MRQAALEAINFAKDRDREDLAADRQFALSVVKCIEIVGEAATGVTPGMRTAHPEVLWRSAIGMRNRLTHAYFEIDYDRVWDLLLVHLPELVEQLDAILGDQE